MFYDEIFKAFRKAEIQYLVAGGVAVNLHGVPRFTMDLDLIIFLETENILKATHTLKKMGYQPRVPVDPEELADPDKRELWKMERNMRVFSFFHEKYPQQVIDLFIEHPLPYEIMDKEKKIVMFRDTPVPLVGRDHLKQMKEVAGRAQDLSDIRALNTLEEEEQKDG